MASIVGEQTLNRVAVGEKGTAGVDIIVTGRTAHGALPWEGANAIEGMARVIIALGRELQPRLAERTHPYFMPSSASVNMIDGGVKANVVPDRCAIFIDRRLIPGEDPVATTAEIRVIAEEAIAGVPGIDVQVIPAADRFAATMSDPDGAPGAGNAGRECYLGLSTELTGFSMASDGRHFAAAGYPTIIYGPGDPAWPTSPTNGSASTRCWTRRGRTRWRRWHSSVRARRKTEEQTVLGADHTVSPHGLVPTCHEFESSTGTGWRGSCGIDRKGGA